MIAESMDSSNEPTLPIPETLVALQGNDAPGMTRKRKKNIKRDLKKKTLKTIANIGKIRRTSCHGKDFFKALSYMGIDTSLDNTPSTETLSMDFVIDYYTSKGLAMTAKGGLSANALAILLQSDGIFYLRAKVYTNNDDFTVTTCMYNAALGVLHANGNTWVVDDRDRVDKISARGFFLKMHPGSFKVLIECVYEIVKS